MSVLHKVQVNELQDVNKWLEIYLPESWSLFYLTRSVLTGRWEGQTFYTLGWPDIRGVVGGELEPNHPCPDFYADHNLGFIFAPKDEDAMILLSLPEVVDWSKHFKKAVVTNRNNQCLEKIAKIHGVDKFLDPIPVTVFHAKPNTLPPRPIPDGCQMRPVKIDSEIDYCVSTWHYRSPNADQYFRALVGRFPSACVADDQDRCLSFEIGTEYGSVGFLHTREEARGKGLAKAVIGRLAEEYYGQLGLGLRACVVSGNDQSYYLHSSLGFKDIGNFFYARYYPQSE